jgi:hypothetical protein
MLRKESASFLALTVWPSRGSLVQYGRLGSVSVKRFNAACIDAFHGVSPARLVHGQGFYFICCFAQWSLHVVLGVALKRYMWCFKPPAA